MASGGSYPGPMPRTTLAALLAALVLVAGCGDAENAFDQTGPGADDAEATTTTTTTTAAPEPTGPPIDCEEFRSTAADEVAAEGTPDPAVPEGPADELCTIDVKVGDGDEVTEADAAAGVEVEVNYVGVGQQTGQTFDSSFERGQPISFPLNGVIQGWTEGLVGMKVGGRRQLVIPGDLGYSSFPPQGSGILPDETLVFVVDLIAIHR